MSLFFWSWWNEMCKQCEFISSCMEILSWNNMNSKWKSKLFKTAQKVVCSEQVVEFPCSETPFLDSFTTNYLYSYWHEQKDCCTHCRQIEMYPYFEIFYSMHELWCILQKITWCPICSSVIFRNYQHVLNGDLERTGVFDDQQYHFLE